MEPKEYERVSKLIRITDELKAQESERIKAESKAYKDNCDRIRKEIADKAAMPLKDDIVFIHNLNTQHMPFSLMKDIIDLTEDETMDQEYRNIQINNIVRD